MVGQRGRFFFFNDTATPEVYTLSLHDALPIYSAGAWGCGRYSGRETGRRCHAPSPAHEASPARTRSTHAEAEAKARSEEHTSELQSRQYLVCRLLLEKKDSDSKAPMDRSVSSL